MEANPYSPYISRRHLAPVNIWFAGVLKAHDYWALTHAFPFVVAQGDPCPQTLHLSTQGHLGECNSRGLHFNAMSKAIANFILNGLNVNNLLKAALRTSV
jgi:hypothetical protein